MHHLSKSPVRIHPEPDVPLLLHTLMHTLLMLLMFEMFRRLAPLMRKQCCGIFLVLHVCWLDIHRFVHFEWVAGRADLIGRYGEADIGSGLLMCDVQCAKPRKATKLAKHKRAAAADTFPAKILLRAPRCLYIIIRAVL